MSRITLLILIPYICSCSTTRRNFRVPTIKLTASEINAIEQSVLNFRKIRGDYAVAGDTSDKNHGCPKLKKVGAFKRSDK